MEIRVRRCVLRAVGAHYWCTLESFGARTLYKQAERRRLVNLVGISLRYVCATACAACRIKYSSRLFTARKVARLRCTLVVVVVVYAASNTRTASAHSVIIIVLCV